MPEEKALMLITYKDQVMKVNVPQDEDQHMVFIMTQPEGEAVYLDGYPVNSDTGDHEAKREVPHDLLESTDRIVAFLNKMRFARSDLKKVDELISSYEKIRAELVGVETPPEEVPPTPPDPPEPRELTNV